MGKSHLKGMALRIDWNTSIPSQMSGFPRIGNSEETQILSSTLQGRVSSKQPESHNPTVPIMPSDGLHAAGGTQARRLSRAVDEREGRTWRPDVYVHAFVPESLSAVNRSPASVISTPGVQGIDFGSYISTFAGNNYLSMLEPPPLPGMSDKLPVPTGVCLHPSEYGQHFEDCLALDMNARIPESRSYDLFGVPLGILDPMQQVYSLNVPGLKENTPSVSLGDSLLLRQLIVDPSTGLPRGMNIWLAPGGGFERGLQAPGFTGYEISAVILSVDRANEVLFFRAHGLVLAGSPVCNVSFVVQPRLITSVQRAVTDIAQQLCLEDGPNRGLTGASSNTRTFHSGHTPNVGHLATNPAIRNEQQPLNRAITTQLPALQGKLALGADLPQTRRMNSWVQRVLFPQEVNGVQQKGLPSAAFSQSWYDRSLNYEQKKAVDAVQFKSYGDFCYLINGPPGTGKTKTMCEIVAQLGKDESFHGSILLCAPSNPAADTLALRLRPYFEPKTLLRLNDFSRTFAEVPQELLPYCFIKDDIFNLPPLSQLMQYKVVVATCQATDILVQARATNRDLTSLQNNLISTINPEYQPATAPMHWAALLVDEAAQATEPENLIPLTVVSPPTFNPRQECPIFAMAGDQHQLNPRTYHRLNTLHISLFERLSNTSVYASHPLARRTLHRAPHHKPMLRPPFMNLIRNYRSHPAILAIPSSLFYENTLIPEGVTTDSLASWSSWRGRRWPVIFACNGGMDECEDIRGVSGGWYNVREAHKAVAYAQDLLDQGLISDQREICIMSPFPAQVHLIRRLARQSKLWAVNIGPMEAFQGLESRFVIVCTTRARKRFLDEDELRGIGIVNEKKKFNVAITRAKDGLIVLGNPWVLATDPCWLTFMQFCWRNSLWHSEDVDLRVQGFEEAKVGDWQPPPDPVAISGLEAALLFKERDKNAGSQAAKRFMKGNESVEETLWRSGLQAEEDLDVSGLNISGDKTGPAFEDRLEGEVGGLSYDSE